MDRDTGTTDGPLQQLAAGFSALSDEYKDLARRYQQLETKLTRAQEQCNTLRSLLPKEKQETDNEPLETDFTIVRARNLNDWLQKYGQGDEERLTAIRDAQLARLKVQSQLQAPHNPSARASSVPATRKVRINADVDTLQQESQSPVTQERGPGTCANCPFADTCCQLQKMSEQVQEVSNHVSRFRESNLDGVAPSVRSKRALSLIDPIRPNIVKSGGSSSGGENCQACPIRFLNLHTPEDVAAYFEEHKHELPRSHEVCIKRFEANADSIRELDAKYGNLVNMIQGLGEKHQPMLPEEPNPEVLAEAEEQQAEAEQEQVSKNKIQRWATAVSEYQGTDVEVAAEQADDEASEEKEEARESRFDREMREIRVGESPSRPWGVHVPAHVLQRNESTLSSLPAKPGVYDERPNQQAHASTGISLAQDDQVLAKIRASRMSGEPVQPISKISPPQEAVAAKPAGKCPFDHTALMKMRGSSAATQVAHGSPSVAPAADGTNAAPLPAETPAEPVQAPTTTATSMAPILTGTTTPREAAAIPPVPSAAGQFVNHGIAIIQHPEALRGFAGIENKGTMVIGYSEADAVAITKNLQTQAR